MNGLIKKGLTEESRAKLLVEYWKQNTAVQQHFNDISMKVRNFAIVIYSGFLTAVALSLHKGVFVNIFGLDVSAAFMFAIAGAITTQLIHFMDTHWYHKMLKGAVGTSLVIEGEIKKALKVPQLSEEISRASQEVYLLKFLGITFPISPKPKLKIFSEVKADSTYRHMVFYRWLIFVILIIGSLSLFSQPLEHNDTVKYNGKPVINNLINFGNKNTSETYDEIEKCFLNKLINKERINDLLIQAKDIYFSSDESLINLDFKNNKKNLDEIVRIVLKHSDYNFKIEGAASFIGGLEYNADLGFKRAESLKLLLIKNGVRKEYLLISSIGEQQVIKPLDKVNELRSVSIRVHEPISKCNE